MTIQTRPSIVALIAALLICLDGQAWADQVILESIKDNTLYQSAAVDLSNGAGTSFFAGVNNQGQIRRGLVGFDVAASIPAGATIDAVTLTLHMSQTSTGPQFIDLHRVLSNWGEGTSVAPGMGGGGAPATPGDATWLYTFYDTDLWSTVGGDYASGISAGGLVDQVGFYSWSSLDLINDVQTWVDNPAVDFGWLLAGNEAENGTTKRFDTHEHIDADLRPSLLVHYTPIPGPGVLACLALGLLGRSPRRRG
jgi:hypothetical protein